MGKRAFVVGLLLLTALTPAAVIGEEPAEEETAATTPWAAAREALRGQSPLFRRESDRRLHRHVPAAVEAALTWLAAHQSPDGRWEAGGFARWCDGAEVPEGARADGAGLAIYDVGVTGLALNAFLVAGYTGEGKHAFATAVRKGLRWLRSVQDAEGCYGARVVSPVEQVHVPPGFEFDSVTRRMRQVPGPEPERNRPTWVYNQATATHAMVEAYGMTGRDEWKESAQRGLDLIALARNPYFVWRYGIKPGDSDTSVTGWMMLPIETARRIDSAWSAADRPPPFTTDEDTLDGIRAWMNKMTDPDYARAGYMIRGGGSARPQRLVDRFPADKSEAMTAVAMLARVFVGENPQESLVFTAGLKLLQKLPPTWNEQDGSIDMIYWHFGSLAVYQLTRPRKNTPAPSAMRREWADWLHQVEAALVEHQRTDGEVAGAKGSWDPVGVWGQAGGRVYATALNALTLLTPVRYEARRP